MSFIFAIVFCMAFKILNRLYLQNNNFVLGWIKFFQIILDFTRWRTLKIFFMRHAENYCKTEQDLMVHSGRSGYGWRIKGISWPYAFIRINMHYYAIIYKYENILKCKNSHDHHKPPILLRFQQSNRNLNTEFRPLCNGRASVEKVKNPVKNLTWFFTFLLCSIQYFCSFSSLLLAML